MTDTPCDLEKLQKKLTEQQNWANSLERNLREAQNELHRVKAELAECTDREQVHLALLRKWTEE